MKCYKLTILVIFIFIYSCSKKPDNIQPPPPPVPPPITNFNTTLLKIYEIDSTKPAPNDTISKWSFAYDNSNRIISDSFYSTTLFSSGPFLDVTTLSYSGSDSFCSRRVHNTFVSFSLTATDTAFFTFINGKYSSDSVIYYYPLGGSRAISKTNYSYQEGIVIRNFQNWILQSTYSEMENDTIHQTSTNGAIMYQVDTTFSSGTGTSPPRIFSTNISYLTNPNPFYKIYFPFSVSYINQLGIGNRRYDFNAYAPQYLISQQSSNVGDISYEYTFRSDGYPLTALVTFSAFGTTKTTKLMFVYKE